MTLAQRIAAHFVAPAGEQASRRGAAPPPPEDYEEDAGRVSRRSRSAANRRPPPAVAVLAPPAHAPALGAALGLALARVHRSPLAVLCLWSPQPARAGWRAPAMPAATRVAAALTLRGHDATAAGRLAVVRLGTSCEEAASQALRVSAVAASAPTVVALAGPRAAAFDELLAMQDLVVVALATESDPALAHLATAGLARALTCPVPPADPGRRLAAAGLALLPSTRRVIAAPLAALS